MVHDLICDSLGRGFELLNRTAHSTLSNYFPCSIFFANNGDGMELGVSVIRTMCESC